MKKIFFASDHGGYGLKEELFSFAEKEALPVENLGVFSEESVDYPRIAKEAAKKVLAEDGLWVFLCGTGIWISIAANKVNWIRAALVHTEYEAEKARQHNNANVLCFGGRVIWFELAKDCLLKFLAAEFEGGRHERRVKQLEA